MTLELAPTISPFRRDVHDLLESIDPDAAWRYERCGQAPEEGQALILHCPQNPKHFVREIKQYCMLRICPTCAEYMAGKARDKYREIITQAIQSSPYQRTFSLKFVTLTRSVSVNDDPGGVACQILDDARDCYYELWGKHAGAGMIANLEVGETGHKYHVHAIVWGMYIDQHEISFMWEAFTGDPVTWVEKIDVNRAVREVLKYVTKFTSLDPATLVNLHVALKGKRRLRSYGCFYGVKIEQEPQACPTCGSRLRVSPEIDYEFWAATFVDDSQQRHVAELRRIAASLLQFTEANKSAGNRGPPVQITLFDETGIILPDSTEGL